MSESEFIVDETLDGRLPSDNHIGDSDDVQYFEIKDPIYIKNLDTILNKLRRYRWLYYQSSNYYNKIYDRAIYYPILFLSTTITVLSLFTAANNDKESTHQTVFGYISAGAGILIGVIQKINTKHKFDTNNIKFEQAGKECDKLITRVSSEIKFPDENPTEFVNAIENQILKIKDDLGSPIPDHLVTEYRILSIKNYSDISSEDIKFRGATKIKLNSFKRDCYDFDIADDIKQHKQESKAQKEMISKSQLSTTDSYVHQKRIPVTHNKSHQLKKGLYPNYTSSSKQSPNGHQYVVQNKPKGDIVIDITKTETEPKTLESSRYITTDIDDISRDIELENFNKKSDMPTKLNTV